MTETLERPTRANVFARKPPRDFIEITREGYTIHVPRVSLSEIMTIWHGYFALGEHMRASEYQPFWWDEEVVHEEVPCTRVHLPKLKVGARLTQEQADQAFAHVRDLVWCALHLLRANELVLPAEGVICGPQLKRRPAKFSVGCADGRRRILIFPAQ